MKELVEDLKIANDNLYSANKMLENENKRLNSIIKEAKEIINYYETIRGYYEYFDEELGYDEYNYDENIKRDILEILDKVEEKENGI